MTLHLHIPEECPERLQWVDCGCGSRERQSYTGHQHRAGPLTLISGMSHSPLKKLKTGNISALHPPWLPVSETEKPEMSFDYFGGNRLFMFVLSVDLE